VSRNVGGMVGLIGTSSGSSFGMGGDRLGSSMSGSGVFRWNVNIHCLTSRGWNEEVLQALTAGSCRSLNFFEPPVQTMALNPYRQCHQGARTDVA